MGTNILANIDVTSSATCPGTWADIADMSVSNITVQGTNSVVILIFSMQQAAGADRTPEFRFTVNGSSTGSPIGTSFMDAAGPEGAGITMCWAVDGLSGSSNSFAVQWQTVTGSPIADTGRNRTFQILEIHSGDASIEYDGSASNQTGDPATWGNLFSSGNVTIAGTSSVVLLLANIAYNLEADESTDFQFSVDSTREGPVMTTYTDATNEGNSLCMVHCVSGLSAGTHTFELQWQARTGNGQTRAVVRTFQVIEVTANAVLKLDLESSASGSAPGTWGDVTGLSSSFTVDGTTAIQFIAANAQIAGASDREADFRIGVDSTEEGAYVVAFTDDDSPALCQGVCLVRLKTGLSAASHTFAMRWQDITATPTLDTGRARTLYVVEFTQITYKLDGITKDKDGVALGSCECYLVKDNGDDTFTFVAYVLSNASTGAYSFTGLLDNDAAYQVISWKDTAPNVFDVTDFNLQPVVE